MKNEKTVGITGASGSLGRELTKLFRQKGYKVIGFTHSKINSEIKNIFDFKFNDFTLENYDPHPHIKGKVAV